MSGGDKHGRVIDDDGTLPALEILLLSLLLWGRAEYVCMI